MHITTYTYMKLQVVKEHHSFVMSTKFTSLMPDQNLCKVYGQIFNTVLTFAVLPKILECIASHRVSYSTKLEKREWNLEARNNRHLTILWLYSPLQCLSQGALPTMKVEDLKKIFQLSKASRSLMIQQIPYLQSRPQSEYNMSYIEIHQSMVKLTR